MHPKSIVTAALIAATLAATPAIAQESATRCSRVRPNVGGAGLR
jgi:hypothetical protein